MQQHLAVVGDPHHRARQRLADRTDLLPVPRVEGRGGARLGEAVALQHREADTAEEVAEPLAQRGASGDRVLAAAAEHRAQLAEHQLVEDLVLDPQARRRAFRGAQRTAVGDRRVGGPVEDLPLAVGLRLGARRVVDLLEHPRHTEDQRRPERGQFVGEVLDVRHAAELDRGHHRGDLDQPAEDVGGGEEEQDGTLARTEEGLEPLHDVAALREEAAVGQHAALGAAGRARGVDDRRGVVGLGAHHAQVQRLVRHTGARRHELADGTPVDLPDVFQGREPVPHGGDGLRVGATLHDDRDRAGIAEYPLDLLGGAGLVHRHGDGARAPDREVQQDPLEAGAGHEGDAVAGLDPRGDQAPGGVLDLSQEPGRRDVRPDSGHLPAHHRDVGMLSGVAADEIRQIAVRRDLVQGRKAELAQDCCSSSGSGSTALCDVPDRSKTGRCSVG
ncbi:hypothetical protein OKW18_005007 [Streptomyces pratensis]|nr:hypothetical protein [Streptomyces pratensis]